MSTPIQSGRDIALEVLKRVATQGAFASATLRGLLSDNDLPARERALATELVYGVLRTRGHLDRALKKASGKRVKDLDPALHDVLRLGTYQLAYLDRVPDHAAVNAAVEAAKKKRGMRGSRTVNAILRNVAKSDTRIPPPVSVKADPIRHVAELGSVSHAIAGLLIEDLGLETACAFVQASLERAPLTLRANLLRVTPAALAEEVQGQIATLPYAVTSESGMLPSDVTAVAEGRASPQDEASMRVVELLDPQPGETILDLCAAPGGKTTHAAERMKDQGRIVAHDRLPGRLARVDDNRARLGLTIIETTDVLPKDSDRFDRVLVDAPCSGLGTLRRHPEIRWRFKPSDLDGLTAVQQEVLQTGARYTAPGGVLVYSVCTVTRAEGEAQVAQLEGFELETTIRTGPQDPGAPDGFFAARLRRR